MVEDEWQDNGDVRGEVGVMTWEELGGGSIGEHFGDLDDPRVERTRRHQLLDIIAIAICGVICGADSWVDLELFGQSKHEWLKQFLSLPGGIPSHDTFGRVFARLDPQKFTDCFTGIPQMNLAFLGKVFSGMEPTIFQLPQNVN